MTICIRSSLVNRLRVVIDIDPSFCNYVLALCSLTDLGIGHFIIPIMLLDQIIVHMP